MKKQKQIGYILLLTIVLAICVPFLGNKIAYAMNAPELVTYKNETQEEKDELRDVANRLGVSPTITVTHNGKTKTMTINKYWLNVFPVEKRLLVYGTREDVDYLHGNNLNQGYWRYAGYNVEGQPMGNPNYPPDEGGTFHPKDRQWRKYTWDEQNKFGSQWKYDEILKQRQNGGSIIVPQPVQGSVYTNTPEWMNKGTWTNGNKVNYKMSDFQLSGQLHEYIYVQQAPGQYTMGTGIMYHRGTDGRWWYIQVIFPPIEIPKTVTNVIDVGVLVHPTTNSAESYVTIDGKHYKFVKTISNYHENKHYARTWGEVGTSVTINQKPQQQYLYIGNSYAEGTQFVDMTKFPNGANSESRAVTIQDKIQYVAFFYTEETEIKSDLYVDFDIIYKGQNITTQAENGIPVKIKKTDFPLTLYFVDKSVSELGQIKTWDWSIRNVQTNTLEPFATTQHPSKTFSTVEDFKKYFNGNFIEVKLEVTDTFGIRGSITNL